MKFEERKYQTDCILNWVRSLEDSEATPVVAVPTGAGKSVIMCGFIEQWFTNHNDSNVLVVSHTKEIVEQDYNALLEFFPPFGVGVYCAGLKKKQVRKITVATIGSVYRKPHLFKDVGLIVVDEVHAVSHKNTGMYRKLFNELPEARITGMSATVFRTGHGYIYEDAEGSDILFNTLAYDLTSSEDFTQLIDDGYLCNLLPRSTKFEMDSTKVKKTGGDYNIKDLSNVHDRAEITKKAIAEMLPYKKAYKKWLIFCIDTKHADNVTDELNANGIKSYVLHTKMPHDRDKTIQAIKDGSITALVSVGMVTTGFDVPDIDLIGMLRPTMSAVLHVQMVGRGLRPHKDKKHCVVLDFAGNTERIGPINDIQINQKKKGKFARIMAKKCPTCRVLNHLRAVRCIACNSLFPVPEKVEKIKKKASKAELIKRERKEQEKQWLEVDNVVYSIHDRAGKPKSLKVTYRCGKLRYQEFVCLNHNSNAQYFAQNWVKDRYPECKNFNTDYVFRNRGMIEAPTHIKVQKVGRYVDITEFKFKE